LRLIAWAGIAFALIGSSAIRGGSEAHVDWSVRKDDLVGRYSARISLWHRHELVLRGDGSYEQLLRQCMMSRSRGRWKLVGDTVKLQPVGRPYLNLFLSPRYVPVRWGDQMILVDEHLVPGFCAAVRERQLVPDNQDPYELFPTPLPEATAPVAVPNRFRRFLLNGAAELTVMSVGGDGTVELNGESLHDLRPGVRLSPGDGGGVWESLNLEVLTVVGPRVTARVLQRSMNRRVVAVGDRFTTGTSFNRPLPTGFTLHPGRAPNPKSTARPAP
jgi:hypothetical protein